MEKSWAAELLRERLRARGLDVGDADKPAITAGGEFLRVVAPHVARAQHRDSQ
jgi:hypothetical protein